MPQLISTETELDEVLTRPSPALIAAIREISSPLLILGAGGKMGPTLAALARRAAEAAQHPLQIIAVSRFSNPATVTWLNKHGIETLSRDLLDPASFHDLPDAANVLFLVGMKFGTSHNPSATWAVNTIAPAQVIQRYRDARIVALSTGNVYPFTPCEAGGATETQALTPLGEYSNAAVGRERIFEYYSRSQTTAVALLRLFYAVELRYGVLVDIARTVHAREPIDLATARFNCIWQGDANDMILRAFPLAASPPSLWNLCRPELFSVRAVAEQFGTLFEQAPVFKGAPRETALLGNAARLCNVLGEPPTSLNLMIEWIAHWVRTGGPSLDRPTHFEVRDGSY